MHANVVLCPRGYKSFKFAEYIMAEGVAQRGAHSRIYVFFDWIFYFKVEILFEDLQ